MVPRLRLALGLLTVLVLVHVHSKQHTFKTVNILYRHGDRTPTHIFPTDKWKNSWKEGLGQLTDVGKMQQFELGQFLHERYTGFMNDNYNATDTKITSTDVDRTLMSAYCNLAGWYPLTKGQRWNANLTWQPIPVHTRPTTEDYLLSFDAVCPKYHKLIDEVKVLPDVVAFNDVHRELYDQLSNYSGDKVESVFDVTGIYDTLMIEKLKNLTLPKWADDAFLEKLHECEKKDFLWSFKTDELKKLRGGLLVGEMIRNMENGNNETSPKAYVYSAHDMTLAAFLSALHMYDGIPPPYASAVMVELHDNDSVRIFYRNTTESEPYELYVPNCSNPCSLQQFKRLTENIVPKNIIEECQVSLLSSDVTLIVAIIASISACALLLAIAAIYYFCRRKPDNYKYININPDM